jgi:hypothetical protein
MNIYYKAECFKIHVPEIGIAQVLFMICLYLITVSSSRVGPFLADYKRKIHNYGETTYAILIA